MILKIANMFPFVRDNKTIGKLLVIRSVTDDGVVTLSNVDFKGAVGPSTRTFPAEYVMENLSVKKNYKPPEILKKADMEPESSEKYLLTLHQGHLAFAMENLFMHFCTPAVCVRTPKSVFALREFEAGDCELLPMSQALKDATGSKQGLFQCTIDNHTYELRKPTDFSPPAWFVRTSKDKKEVNMKIIKKSITVEAFEEAIGSVKKKCILPLLVNTKKLKNGTELVVFEDTCAEKAPSKFGQI